MSVCRFFNIIKRVQFDSNMPNPCGPLSQTMPSSAVAAANKEVRDMLAKKNEKTRGSYHKYTPTQRADIGKYALENGVQSARRKFNRKSKVEINESTVRLFRNQFRKELVKRREEDADASISELHLKKRGRPVLLGDRLDSMVQKYVSDTRKVGGAVSTAIVRAGARGILLNQDKSRLAEFGGPATLTKAWAISVLKRMNFTKRRGTTKCSVPLENFILEKKKFLQQIIDVVQMEEVPPELILNWDQTGLNLVPTSSWTMAAKGSKRVEVKGLTDKRQITGIFCGTILGDFLPIQLIYGRKTTRCHAQYCFPDDWHITHSDNHWSNEKTMLGYIKEIIVPFVASVRDRLNVDHSQAALAIFDCFKGQLTENVIQLLEDYNIQSVIVPASCTDRLQPMDISVNKSAKSFLKSEFQRWYSEEIAKELSKSDGDVNKIDPVDLTTAKMKCISAQWIVRMLITSANHQIL